LYFKTPDNGIIAAAYGPSSVKTQLNGKNVNIDLVTDYPFGESLNFTVDADTAFPFHLRIPSWAVKPTIKIGNNAPVSVTPGQIYIAKLDQGITTLQLNVPMTVRVQNRYNNGVSVYRGPLLYSLKMDTKWTSTHHYAFNSYDWVIQATTPWNYALVLNTQNPSSSFSFTQGTVGPLPYSPDGAPVSLNTNAKILDGWVVTENAAAVPPKSPVTSSNPTEKIQLIPFGATPLRITEFPYINS